MEAIASQNCDTARLIDAKINKSTVFIRQKETRTALSLLKEASELSRLSGDDYSLAYCYNNIGGVYQTTFQNRQAIDYFNRALAIRDDLGDVAGMATTLDNLGKIYTRVKEYDIALAHFFQALKYNQQLGDQRSTAIGLNSIGELLLEKDDYYGALEYFFKAVPIARALRLRHEAQVIYGNILVSYAALGEPDSARAYLALFNAAGDSGWYAQVSTGNTAEAGGWISEREPGHQPMLIYVLGAMVVVLAAFSAWLLYRLGRAARTRKPENNSDSQGL